MPLHYERDVISFASERGIQSMWPPRHPPRETRQSVTVPFSISAPTTWEKSQLLLGLREETHMLV